MTPRVGVVAVVALVAVGVLLPVLAVAASASRPGPQAGGTAGAPVAPGTSSSSAQAWLDTWNGWWNAGGSSGAMISPHFSEREATTSLSAWQAGHTIVPTAEQLANARLLAATVLEPIRAHFGNRPVTITSWIRDAFTNQLIGGSDTSDHLHGLAADLLIQGVDSAEAFEVIRTALLPSFPIDQLIYYSERGHLHVSTRPNPRREAWIDNDP